VAEDWSQIAGRLIPGGHVLPVRIYFEDTDFSGVVYHGSFIRFMERGRSDFVRPRQPSRQGTTDPGRTPRRVDWVGGAVTFR